MAESHSCRRRSPCRLAESCSLSLVLLLTLLIASPGFAADHEDEEDAWHDTPEWVDHIGVSGRYVGIPGGSEAKYLEDQNIQSGPVVQLGIRDEFGEAGLLSIEGMTEPLQDQGYLLFGLEIPERFSLHSDIQAWREFYNTRTGVADETALGTQLNSFFPFTNNSTHFFGGGKPKVDWLRTRTGFAIEVPGPVNDVWGDFLYRRQRGEMSLLKGGTVLDPTVPATPVTGPIVAGSGPGTIAFDVSSRKQVDYERIGASGGGRAGFGGLNLRVDVQGARHELKSTVFEPNFDTTAASSELERYNRDTTLDIIGGNVVLSRSLAHNLFVFGGASVSWEQSEPDPSQVVQTGILSAAPTRVLTRETLNSEITRFTEAVSGGAVYSPTPKVVVRATASVRLSQQEGDLSEQRNESAFATGDVGGILNDSERDTISARARVKADWRAAKRLKVSGYAQYDFRYEDANSTRTFNFTPGELPEIEDYTNERSQVRAGVGGRYRFRKGRSVDGGYEFMYDGFTNDVNELANQFIMADYERFRHRLHVKATGRITRKLHAEVRAEYVFESRTLDAPNVEPPDITAGMEGEIEINTFRITPLMSYRHDEHWSGVLSASIAREEYKLVDDGPSPPGFDSTFAGWAYEVLTGSISASMNWAPTERVTNVFSYTLYGNAESVENLGHDASIRTSFALDDNWDVNGTVRYLGFAPNDNVVDDYDAVIASVGVTGRF